jgi:hypothetical protein
LWTRFLATFGDFRPTFGGVLASFGLFCPSLRRFLQAGSTFVDFLAKSLSVDFCTPFLGSIFAPFLVNSQSRICLFYGTFWLTRVVFGPFSDVFWTVLLVTILSTFHQSGVRVLTLGLLKVLHVLVFTLGVGLVQFVDQ